MFAYLASPNSIVPAAADSVDITPGTGYAWGAYSEMIASAATDLLITGLTARNANSFTTVEQWEIEIATGGAGSETPVGTFGGIHGNAGSTGTKASLVLPFPIQVAAGTRVAARYRRAIGDTTHVQLALRTVPASYTGKLYPSTAVIKTAPSGSSGWVTASGTAWANGTPLQLFASLPNDIVIFMISAGPNGLGWSAPWELDICTGAPGAEVAVSTYRDGSVSMNDTGWRRIVPVRVAAGTRVSVRHRQGGTGGYTLAFKLGYYDNPTDISSEQVASGCTVTFPANGSVGVSVPGGNAWSAWAEVVASAAVDYALLDVVSDFLANAMEGDIDVQVGVGGVGAETPIATVNLTAFTANPQTGADLMPLGVTGITAGSRVSIRARFGSVVPYTRNFTLLVIPKSCLPASLQTTAPPKVLPDTTALSSAWFALACAGWTSGAWVECSTGLTEDFCVFGLGASLTNANYYEVDLGRGPAGSEEVVYTWRLSSHNGGRLTFKTDALIPLPDGVRIALRMRSNDGSDVGVKLHYYGGLSPAPDPVIAAMAFGYQGTVKKSRAVLFSLDGNTNELNEEGKLKVAGKFRATGACTLPGLNVSGILDGLGT